eukprot:8328832-Karenia_brevis.AAC.1
MVACGPIVRGHAQGGRVARRDHLQCSHVDVREWGAVVACSPTVRRHAKRERVARRDQLQCSHVNVPEWGAV